MDMKNLGDREVAYFQERLFFQFIWGEKFPHLGVDPWAQIPLFIGSVSNTELQPLAMRRP
jgi:hypothetical protein